MENSIPGIHHTVIACGPQANIDFYVGILGLRLVKLTVNFDDPTTYHLYYGDGQGHPGTILTFFPWPNAMRGRIGTGQVTVTSFAVPGGSLNFWDKYLQQRRVNCKREQSLLGEEVVALTDPDGLQLQLVSTPHADPDRIWGHVRSRRNLRFGGFIMSRLRKRATNEPPSCSPRPWAFD
jgi:glyoxalase family protein